MAKKKEKVTLEGGIEVPKKEFCDRCGNDFAKGSYWWHFPFIKMHIALCHVCYQGFMYGFYMDTSRQLKELG